MKQKENKGKIEIERILLDKYPITGNWQRFPNYGKNVLEIRVKFDEDKIAEWIDVYYADND